MVDSEKDTSVHGEVDYLVEFQRALKGTTLALMKLPFGVRHRVLRALTNVSIEAVALGAGIHPYTITRWEKYGSAPYRDNQEKLETFWAELGVPKELLVP